MARSTGLRALAVVSGAGAAALGIATHGFALGHAADTGYHSSQTVAHTAGQLHGATSSAARNAAGSNAAASASTGAALAAASGPHADSIYECNQHGGNQTVLEVNHTSGVITAYHGTTTAPIQSAINQAATNVTAPSTSQSGAGDTVIVCQGTYTATSASGDINIGLGNDNLTVRSVAGPASVTIVGDGKAPVVTADDRGLSFGGPAEGFTISTNAPAGTGSLTGIQLGVPGAQSTANEDEQCMNAAGVANSSGCDQAAPADVTVNDQIIDNIFTNFKGAAGAAVTGIKLDNTINSVVQQNLFTNIAPHTAVKSFEGIVVGGFNETAPSPAPSGYQNGDSTNINTAVFQNTVRSALQVNPTGCSATGPAPVQGIELNGFMLDSQVYNNWLVQFLNFSSSCGVTGIFSNAYGFLENEQTGTLVPVNANIDNNTIEQLSGDNHSTNTTGVLLAPTPANANPGAQPPPMTCVSMVNQNCNDNIPPSAYTVVDNELQGLYRAVDDEAVLGANSFIRFNNFDGDAIGVQNGSTPGPQNQGLDATNNWWGCELSGASAPPASVSSSNHNCAALISPAGDTSWAPPQTSRVEQAGDEAGDNAGQS